MTATLSDLGIDSNRIGQFVDVTTGVGRLSVVFVNLYTIDLPQGGWMLVDTGVPFSGWYVQKALDARYGPGAKPLAILLTHAHFDHSGNASAFASAWDVPVYVHPLEMPYVTGQSDYPPQDPTPGGAICFLSRFFPRGSIDLKDRVRPLPEDGSIPDAPGWTWIHTPGHTAGHVSFVRSEDGVVIVGDAIATVNLDAWSTQLTWPQEIARPATPFTPDWIAARESIHKLADLKPKILAAGHGLPIQNEMSMEDALRTFAKAMEEPDGGRYAGKPVQYNADGSVASLPPAAPDPLLRTLAVASVAAAVTIGAVVVVKSLTESHGKDRPN